MWPIYSDQLLAATQHIYMQQWQVARELKYQLYIIISKSQNINSFTTKLRQPLVNVLSDEVIVFVGFVAQAKDLNSKCIWFYCF